MHQTTCQTNSILARPGQRHRQCHTCLQTVPGSPSIKHKRTYNSQSETYPPISRIAMNLCSYAGQDNLIIVDCYTDWPVIIP